MKKLLFILVLILSLVSCKKEYKVYYENNRKIAQLIEIEKDVNVAYIIDYTEGLNKEAFMKTAEKIAKFYNIEGLSMFFYKQHTIDAAEESNMNYTEFLPEHKITPYEYRSEYINESNDTIAKLLWRDGEQGHLYTSQKYTNKDSELLNKIVEYLGLSSCTIYDKPITITLMSYIDCYSLYSSTDGFLFLDEERNGNFFSLDGINIKKDSESERYIKYITNKHLSKEQILKVGEINNTLQKMLYFYLSDNTEKDYASTLWFGDKCQIYMFNEKKTYEYDTKNNSWDYRNHE